MPRYRVQAIEFYAYKNTYHEVQAATEADVPQFEQVLGKALRDTAKEPESVRRTQLLLDTQSRATLLRQRTGARVVVTDSIPSRVYDTDTASALPANLLYRAIIDGDNVRAVSDNTVTVIAQLFPVPAPGRLAVSSTRPRDEQQPSGDQAAHGPRRRDRDQRPPARARGD